MKKIVQIAKGKLGPLLYFFQLKGLESLGNTGFQDLVDLPYFIKASPNCLTVFNNKKERDLKEDPKDENKKDKIKIIKKIRRKKKMKKMTEERRRAARAAYAAYTLGREAQDSAEAYNYREKMIEMMEMMGLTQYNEQAGLVESFGYIYEEAQEGRKIAAESYNIRHLYRVDEAEEANTLNAARFWLNW